MAGESTVLAGNRSWNRVLNIRTDSGVDSSSPRRRAASGFVSAHSAASSDRRSLTLSINRPGDMLPSSLNGLSSWSSFFNHRTPDMAPLPVKHPQKVKVGSAGAIVSPVMDGSDLKLNDSDRAESFHRGSPFVFRYLSSSQNRTLGRIRSLGSRYPQSSWSDDNECGSDENEEVDVGEGDVFPETNSRMWKGSGSIAGQTTNSRKNRSEVERRPRQQTRR